ncbi:MAG: phosphatidate cytidylyltransferase [candidate division Zixibacteria bacterium]|nr:phosphatidate cytidylyltransferase [candidate division Zixibacteria bacterium]
MTKNLVLRLIVAVFGIPALIAICLSGGYYLLGFCILLAGLGGLELGLMLKKRGYRASLFFSILLPVAFVFAAFYNYPIIYVLFYSFFLTTLLIIIDYSRAGDPDLSPFLGDMFGRFLPAVYLGLLASTIINLGSLPDIGGLILLLVFMVVWATDSAAYLGGKTIGKHKLSTSLSPNKTWEGFCSGFLGAALAAVVAKLWFLDISWPKILVISLTACFWGQLGDLFESAIKRHCRVKDSSEIIPGHGGVLDRFDSFLFAVPTVYIIAIYWR